MTERGSKVRKSKVGKEEVVERRRSKGREYCIVLRERERTQRKESGDNSEREAPVPIPNTEVKPFSAEDT